MGSHQTDASVVILTCMLIRDETPAWCCRCPGSILVLLPRRQFLAVLVTYLDGEFDYQFFHLCADPFGIVEVVLLHFSYGPLWAWSQAESQTAQPAFFPADTWARRKCCRRCSPPQPSPGEQLWTAAQQRLRKKVFDTHTMLDCCCYFCLLAVSSSFASLFRAALSISGGDIRTRFASGLVLRSIT